MITPQLPQSQLLPHNFNQFSRLHSSGNHSQINYVCLGLNSSFI